MDEMTDHDLAMLSCIEEEPLILKHLLDAVDEDSECVLQVADVLQQALLDGDESALQELIANGFSEELIQRMRKKPQETKNLIEEHRRSILRSYRLGETRKEMWKMIHERFHGTISINNVPPKSLKKIPIVRALLKGFNKDERETILSISKEDFIDVAADQVLLGNELLTGKPLSDAQRRQNDLLERMQSILKHKHLGTTPPFSSSPLQK